MNHLQALLLQQYGRSIICCLLLLLCLFGSSPVLAQKSAGDSLRVKALLDKGDVFFNDEQLDSAAYYYLKAREYASKRDYKRGIVNAMRWQLKLLNRQGRYKEGLALALEGVELSKHLDKRALAAVHNNVGYMYASLGNLEASTDHFLQALTLAEALGDKQLQMKYSNNLAATFGEFNKTEKCHEYAIKSYELALQLKDTAGMVYSLTNVSATEITTERYANATKNSMTVLKLAEKAGDTESMLIAYANLGEIEEKQSRFHKALGYYQQCLQLLHYYPIPRRELYTYWSLARTYYKQGMYAEASHYLQRSIAIGKTINASNELRQIYQLGSDIYEKMNKLSVALGFRKKYEALNDSLLSAETQQSVNRMEIEYQTTQKEKEIAQQNLVIARNNLDIEKKNNLIYLSAAVVIALISCIIIFFMLYRNKQKANADRLRSLKRDNDIKVLMAMIEGEEKERARLARELHDGVGGILSATKMHLSILKNEQEGSNGTSATLAHTVSMIDNAAQEIRTISHNLSPQLLMRHELQEALASFCCTVSNATLQVAFYQLGNPLKLKSNFKLVVYRIVQELVNNIIKHAGASHALVQLSQHDNLLSLTVEDNGIGFEPGETNGIGLANLQERIKDMNGHMTIESTKGRGTAVYLEFDVSPFLEEKPLVSVTA